MATHYAGRRPGAVVVLLLFGWGLLFGGGCAQPLPRWNLAASGWAVREAAALWRPSRDADEVVGEISVASHPDGSRLVRFSKQGLTWMTARVGQGVWEFSAVSRHGIYRGRGKPPSRLVWFEVGSLERAPESGRGWTVTVREGGGWVMEATGRGERLEVVP